MSKVKVTRIATFEYMIDREGGYQDAPDHQVIEFEKSEEAQYYGIVEGFETNFKSEVVTVEFVEDDGRPRRT